MSSVSGLGKAQRAQARRRAYNAAWLTYSNRTRVHYTQGARRWDGIDQGPQRPTGPSTRATPTARASRRGASGTACTSPSTSATPSTAPPGKPATPARCSRTANGSSTSRTSLVGDCVIYGGGTGKHTAIVIGKGNGRVMVISHGSEARPVLHPLQLPLGHQPDPPLHLVTELGAAGLVFVCWLAALVVVIVLLRR